MFYVYHSFGCCNHGDHSCGLDVYETAVDAEAACASLRRAALGCGDSEPHIEVIEGVRRPGTWGESGSIYA